MQHSRSELRRMIARAVDDTTLFLPHSEKSGPALHFQQFLAIASELRAHSPEALRGFVRQFTPVESTGRDELSHYLSSLSALDKYFDDSRQFVTCVGSPGTSISVGIPLSEISSKVIMSAIVNSVDVATEALHSFLMTDSFPMRLIFILVGSKISKEIILDNHCKLIPAVDAISLVDLSSIFHPLLASIDKDFLGCGLIVETNVQPGTWDADSHIAPNVLLQGVAEADIGLLCGILTLVSQRQFYPIVRTHIIDQEIVDTLPIVEHSTVGGLTVLNHLVPLLPSDLILPYLDTQELRSLVSNYAECDDKVQRHLQIPLSRFQSTTGRMNHVDRCIDLAIAFESMLMNKYKPNIDKRLAERAAWLYSETKTEKLRVYDEMLAFYQHRSAIVHGKEVPEDVDLYLKAQSIFIVCLKNIIKRKAIPDWDSINISTSMGNIEVKDPATLLSAKHDATSWTIEELEHIDEVFSEFWKSTLQTAQPSGSSEIIHTQDVHRTISEFNNRGEPYIFADPERLRDLHPYLPSASKSNDEARVWHCDNDIKRHVDSWIEAAAGKGLTVIVDSSYMLSRQ